MCKPSDHDGSARPLKTPIRTLVPHHRHTPDEIGLLCAATSGKATILLTHKGQIGNDYIALRDIHENIEIHNISERMASFRVGEDLDTIIQSLSTTLNCLSTPLIWERSTTSVRNRISLALRGNRHSFHKGSIYITLEILKQQYLLSSINVNCLVYASTPHTIGPWAQMHAALGLGVDIIVVSRSAVPGFFRAFYQNGERREPVSIVPLSREQREIYRARTKSLINDIKSTYEQAMPEYERKRMEANHGKYVSAKQLMARNWYSPLRILNTIQSWRQLTRLSISYSELASKRFVIFFMHYQPERTTVPDGNLFGVQTNALIALRACLPKEVEVVVKEHPSTFRHICHSLARDPDFFRQIASIDGVSWIDIATDNFTLIDNALITATITGTVAIESLIRGTPAVMFGASFLGSSKGLHRYTDSKSLQAFIDSVIGGALTPHLISMSATNSLMRDQERVFYCNSGSLSTQKINALKALVNVTSDSANETTP